MFSPKLLSKILNCNHKFVNDFTYQVNSDMQQSKVYIQRNMFDLKKLQAQILHVDMLIHDCNRCNNNNARNSSRILSHRHQSNKTPVTFGMFYDKYAKSGWDDSLSFRVAGYNRRKGGRGTPLQGLYVAARRRV